ncbi:WD40-repeat-containing domain protein [Multifurca ochricompacta]|uniref:WD40-repeat-containing domain protein n=1 Tax=Multifurca ochricompacta TaxID=376703 RepID=A0AAD4LUG5_9AGAM|nr:WD40-repeat-containing domain protein [Multifurca ochricompacta]
MLVTMKDIRSMEEESADILHNITPCSSEGLTSLAASTSTLTIDHSQDEHDHGGHDCLQFSPASPNFLLASAWDSSSLSVSTIVIQTVRLYDIAANEEKTKFDHRAAVLSTTFSDASHAYSGGLDASLRELELESEKIHALGQHDDAISSVCYSGEAKAIITGSWDRSIHFWDPRAATTQQSSHQLPERIYFMDAPSLFHILDVRKMETPEQTRDNSLKFLTRALACMSDGQGYATASVEGRIAVEYFDPSSAVQEKKYAFKCHRQTIDEVDHVWPVNALAFHPTYNTFASGGSDATVSIWDHKVKKRLRQFPRYNSSVSTLAFSADGSRLAIGASYTWDAGEEGARTADRPALFVRELGEEVKPKGWGTS